MPTTNVVKAVSAGDSVSIGQNITTGTITVGESLTSGSLVLRGIESGTWTPVMGDGTNTFTLSVATGQYTRIGNMVQCWCKVQWTDIGSPATTGDVQITGLPLTVDGDTSFAINAITGGGYQHPFFTSGKCVDGTTRIDLYLSYVTAGSYFRITQINPNNNLNATGILEFQFAYRT